MLYLLVRILRQFFHELREVAEFFQLGDGLLYLSEAVGCVYKADACLYGGVVVSLYIAYIPCLVKLVPLYYQSNVLALFPEVVAVTLYIVEVFPEAVMLKECLDISALTVTDDVKMIVLF